MINEKITYIINEGFDPSVSPQIEVYKSDKFHGKAVGKAIFQRANEKNRNGRFYDARELFAQLKAPRTVELLRTGSLYSEDGHPLTTGANALQRQATIDKTKACSRILELHEDGEFVKGTFVACNNPLGLAFDMDIKEGLIPAWSLRALGTVENTNRGAEVKNLKLITYDNVIFPSHPGAYTETILGESTNVANTNKEISVTESGIIIPVCNDDIIKFIQTESANLKFIRDYFDFQYSNIQLNESGTKVILTENTGNTIVVPVETHIHNELMTYASEIKNLID